MFNSIAAMLRTKAKLLSGNSDRIRVIVANDFANICRKGVRLFIMDVVRELDNKFDKGYSTGMSIASLRPLAKEVRLRAEVVRRTLGWGYRPGYADSGGGYRSKAHGELLGESAFRLHLPNPEGIFFRFEFKINVFQWELHENHFGTTSSVEPGLRELDEFIKDASNALFTDAYWAQFINFDMRWKSQTTEDI